MAELTTGGKWAIGIGLAGAAAGVLAAFWPSKAEAAPEPGSGGGPASPGGLLYSADGAISALLLPAVMPPIAIVVPLGASLRAEHLGGTSLWNDVSTSDATVLAPSIPPSSNGFFANAPGTATLKGSYASPVSTDASGLTQYKPVQASILVVVKDLPADPDARRAFVERHTSYNATQAIQSLVSGLTAPAPTRITVPVGASITVFNDANTLWDLTITSDAMVVAPSFPPTTNGYVAVAPGVATITGFYSDWAKGMRGYGQLQVTVK
jgi:hypothetical protein